MGLGACHGAGVSEPRAGNRILLHHRRYKAYDVGLTLSPPTEAAVPDHDRGVLALHRPARVRPRLVRVRGARRRCSDVDLDVAGYATVTETASRSRRRPRASASSRSPEDDQRLYSLVGWDEKFAAHNAALWQHGLLVVVPKGVELEKPLYVRIAATGQTFWRLLVVAEEEARASLIEEYASPAPDTEAYSNAVTELFVEQAAKLEYVSLQNLSQETWHFATHHARVERDAELDWVAGGFGSKKGKTRIQNDLNGRGATSRVTGAYFADGDAAPRLRHVPGAHRARLRVATSPSRARCATRRRRSGAG